MEQQENSCDWQTAPALSHTPHLFFRYVLPLHVNLHASRSSQRHLEVTGQHLCPEGHSRQSRRKTERSRVTVCDQISWRSTGTDPQGTNSDGQNMFSFLSGLFIMRCFRTLFRTAVSYFIPKGSLFTFWKNLLTLQWFSSLYKNKNIHTLKNGL